MMFSNNQVRQFYGVKARKAKGNIVTAADEAGTIALNTTKDGDLFFSYKSPGGILRSDIIKVANIISAQSTSASKMVRPLKAYTIKLDSNINGGEPVAGQDYILRIAFTQFAGMSDENTYDKFGVVRTYSGMLAAKFYETLAVSLYQNFSRELTPLVKFTLGGSVVAGVKVVNGETVPVDSSNNAITGTSDGITITELPQEWTLGIKEQVPVYFNVIPSTITVDGAEIIWGKTTDATPTENLVTSGATQNAIHNGKKVADMEYFFLGERGDQYRGIGFPNNLKTEYVINPNNSYHMLDIHFAYIGDNHAVQKSEKTITIACATAQTLNDLIGEINTAITDSGIDIEDVT